MINKRKQAGVHISITYYIQYLSTDSNKEENILGGYFEMEISLLFIYKMYRLPILLQGNS